MACFDVHRAFLNVGYELTEKQLRTYFAKVGLVSDIHLPKHRSGRNKGFGFATFDTAEALRRALLAPRAAPQAPKAVSLTPNNFLWQRLKGDGSFLHSPGSLIYIILAH